MNLGEFRSELAETLCNYKRSTENKRGRPSINSIEKELEAKKHRGPMKAVPPKDIRSDGVNHNERRCNKKTSSNYLDARGFHAQNVLSVRYLFAILKTETVLQHSIRK